MGKEKQVTVLGAGYSGLTTAAELTLRGFKVKTTTKLPVFYTEFLSKGNIFSCFVLSSLRSVCPLLPQTRVVAADLGFRPPLTIVGTQSRRYIFLCL